MSFSLSSETQQLIAERMRQSGIETPDELVRLALLTLDTIGGENYEALDDGTRAAIEEAEG